MNRDENSYKLSGRYVDPESGGRIDLEDVLLNDEQLKSVEKILKSGKFRCYTERISENNVYDDADSLLLNAPLADLTEAEAALLSDYVTNGGKLTGEAFAAMWKLKEHGFKLIPVTGRPAGWCDMMLRQWPVQAVICENGAFVYDYDEHNAVRMIRHPLAAAEPKKLLEPVKAAVLPLSKKPELQTVAQNLADDLRFNEWMIDYDESGAIGRRYRRQDEIGTPLCITVDFDTLEDHAVTIRERDTMAQERVALDKVADYVAARIGEKRTRVPLKPVEMGGEPWPESGVQEAGGLY